MAPTHVHFNGSVNLADADTVMREIVSRVPAGVRRIPDGETGDRGNWIGFQMQKFLQLPALVPTGSLDAVDGDYGQMPQLRLADGFNPAQMSWPDLGYADAYIGSYATFAALRDEGVIPAGSGSRSSTQRPWLRSALTLFLSTSRLCSALMSGPCSLTLADCSTRSRMTIWPCNGTSQSNSASSRKPSRPAARKPSMRLSRAWPVA